MIEHYGEFGEIYERFNRFLLYPEEARRYVQSQYDALQEQIREEEVPPEPIQPEIIPEAPPELQMGVEQPAIPPEPSVPSVPSIPRPPPEGPPSVASLPSVEAARRIPIGSREPEYSTSLGTVEPLPGLWERAGMCIYAVIFLK